MTPTFDITLAAEYLKDHPLGFIKDELKNAAINLANAGLTSDENGRNRLILEAQAAIFEVTELLDAITLVEHPA